MYVKSNISETPNGLDSDSYFRGTSWRVCPFRERREERSCSMKFFVWQGECHIHLGRNVFLSRITNSLFQMFENCSTELC